jgi:hypothetical protein
LVQDKKQRHTLVNMLNSCENFEHLRDLWLIKMEDSGLWSSQCARNFLRRAGKQNRRFKLEIKSHQCIFIVSSNEIHVLRSEIVTALKCHVVLHKSQAT